MGCHQSSSTAGFHLLGNDRTDFGLKPLETRKALDGNRLALPFSPHLFAELPRRQNYVSRLALGEHVNDFRPHPSAPAAQWNNKNVTYTTAGENMPCPLPEQAEFTATSTWSCRPGLSCKALAINPAQTLPLGQCVPEAKEIFAGLSCREDKLKDNLALAMKSEAPLLAYNIRSYIDEVSNETQIYGLTDGKLDAKQYNCRPTRIGVPLGRVTKVCNDSESKMTNFDTANIPKEMCAIVGGKGFEEMAKGYFSSRRFAEGVGRGLLNTCSAARPCREDYICQEMPEFLADKKFGVSNKLLTILRENKVGFCTPTYFVYQLRLDGHPNPN
jgi:hypothetical protein